MPTTILEELKARQAQALARQAAAQAAWQAAQVEMNAANAELGIWNSAVAIETREEAARAAAAAKDQIPMGLQANMEAAMEPESPQAELEPEPEEESEQFNKTEYVRDLLRANPGGLTIATIWTAFHQQAPKASRNYLYSVLKRLRDKKQVEQKRGKYMFKAKPPAAEQIVEGGLLVN